MPRRRTAQALTSRTWGTHARAPLLAGDEVVALALSQFLRAGTETGFAILAYCFMPDHVHLLVEGSLETSDCRRFIARAKQASGYAHSCRFGGRLWQRYSFERVLRADEPPRVVARYILANPVRAGLVARVEDYPFVGSPAYGLDALLRSL